MKIDNFDYFKPMPPINDSKLPISAESNKKVLADEKDFDIDFQYVPKEGIPTTQLSGNTCTLLCKITEWICPSLFFC